MSPRPTLLPEQLAPRPSRFRNFLDAFCCGPRLGLSITSPGTYEVRSDGVVVHHPHGPITPEPRGSR